MSSFLWIFNDSNAKTWQLFHMHTRVRKRIAVSCKNSSLIDTFNLKRFFWSHSNALFKTTKKIVFSYGRSAWNQESSLSCAVGGIVSTCICHSIMDTHQLYERSCFKNRKDTGGNGQWNKLNIKRIKIKTWGGKHKYKLKSLIHLDVAAMNPFSKYLISHCNARPV